MYMDFEIGLVEKQDEEVDEGFDLVSEQRSTPLKEGREGQEELSLKEWEGLLWLTRF